MLLSIITGTYNRLPHLKAMMESARNSLPPNFTPGVEYEFVICDGGSTDGTLEWLKDQPGVRTLAHGQLLGAIKAFNDAGRAAQGDYLCPANDDIVFLEHALARGLAYMMDNPEVGAGAFYQDRNGKMWHVEEMPLYRPDGSQESVPYVQVGLIPRWLWNHCGGWGEGKTYGGDCFVSGKIYEAGYKIVPIEGCHIHDETVADSLRQKNTEEAKDDRFWDRFRFAYHETPQVPNPLPIQKRVLYAPIIESGHTVQKDQKRGLRDALGSLGVVWEVDYQYARESILEAAKAWAPHFTVTQIHAAHQVPVETVRELTVLTQEWSANFNGDVWQAEQSDPMYLDLIRHFDFQLCVNASLLPLYKEKGIYAAYWQNSFEPQVIESGKSIVQCDVVFCGNNYQVEGVKQSREKLVECLKSMPHKVKIFGRGYADGISEGESLYDYRKTGEIYRGAKIAVGDNQFLEATGFCSDRAFMILAAGNCLMLHQKVNQIGDLLGLIPGKHFVEWTDLPDLTRKVAYYLEHEEERAAIARAGTEECRKHHTFHKRVEQLVALMHSRPRARHTISAMMIVKNEARNILDNLDQLGSFADEIVVVDTGSTDDTMAVMERWRGYHPKANLKVYPYKWNNDFAAARNFAKGQCTQEWIYWQDADDRITDRMLRSFKTAWPWRSRWHGKTDIRAYKVFYQDQTGHGCMQVRLFRNIPKVEWRMAAGETLDLSLADLGIVPVGFTGYAIIHHGTTDPAVQARKQAYYIQILKDRERPGPVRDIAIAMAYAASGKHGRAYLWFQHVYSKVQDKDLKSWLSFSMGFMAYQCDFPALALECLEKSEFPDAYYVRFLIQDQLGKRIYTLLQTFLEKGIDPVYPTFAPAWRERAQKILWDWHAQELDQLAETVPFEGKDSETLNLLHGIMKAVRQG